MDTTTALVLLAAGQVIGWQTHASQDVNGMHITTLVQEEYVIEQVKRFDDQTVVLELVEVRTGRRVRLRLPSGEG